MFLSYPQMQDWLKILAVDKHFNIQSLHQKYYADEICF